MTCTVTVDPTEHLRLVSKVAKKYVSKNVPIADTIEYSAGVFGLLSAAKNYDPEKHKTKFSTYAFDCINKSIIQNWRNQQCAKRSPVNQFSIHDAETETELFDYRSPKKYNSAIEIMFKDHPNDSEKDIRNKKFFMIILLMKRHGLKFLKNLVLQKPAFNNMEWQQLIY